MGKGGGGGGGGGIPACVLKINQIVVCVLAKFWRQYIIIAFGDFETFLLL